MMHRSSQPSPGRILSAGLRATVVAVFVFFGAGAAHADLCRQLEAQLAALGAGSRANPEQIGRYDIAIASQQGELQKAREQSRQAGCDARPSAMCTSLRATVERMNANLANLQQARARMASTAALQAERARLNAHIQTSGCRETRQSEDARPSETEVGSMRSGIEVSGNRIAARAGGTYRTLCVRMCDGFYFPISHSTPPQHFERDEKLCAARCPGTRVELHYHRFPGQEADEMVSVPTGTPYRQSDNAFRYRQASWERPANCGCGIDRGFEVLAGERQWEPLQSRDEARTEHDEASATERVSSGSFLIQQEPPRALTAETIAEEQAAAAAAEPEIDETVTAVERPLEEVEEERRIRVVGPTFLPDPEEAIDLQSRDPYRAR
jgi:hypothetical protein